MTVYVETTGQGPNLTLLHGWGLNGAVWNGVRDALAEHFTLHIVDLPGHGRSQDVPVSTLPAMVEAVAAAMPARSHLLGWSLGGHTALALAHAFPERVDKLATVGSTPCYVGRADWPYGKKTEVLDDFAHRLGTHYTATIRNFLALQALNQPNMRDTIRKLQEAVSAHGAPSLDSLQASLAILRASDIRDRIPGIGNETLVIQGDHDALTMEPAARWLADHLPNGQYHLMAHAAHAPFLSHRDAFLQRLMAFLHA